MSQFHPHICKACFQVIKTEGRVYRLIFAKFRKKTFTKEDIRKELDLTKNSVKGPIETLVSKGYLIQKTISSSFGGTINLYKVVKVPK